jgi:predicted nucleic acid-binding Zn ribbon protein
MSSAALKKCPECGKFKLVRLIGTGGGIIFRGSGFYCNDYGDKKAPEHKVKGENTE